MVSEKSLNIVCISPVPWDYPIWTNRQHIMLRLSTRHKVLYVFHPILLRSSIKRNISLKSSKLVSPLKKINNNLFVYTPFILPFGNRILSLKRINIFMSVIILNNILKKLAFNDFILWFYDPEAVHYLNYLKPILSCYDCVDEYSAMPDYESNEKKQNLIELEKKLIRKCDMVFTTSKGLYEKKKQLNPNTFLVENVGDYDHFNRAYTERFVKPQDLPPGSPVIGFIGAVDHYKVDFDLIEYMAITRPNWKIVLIGSKMNSKEKGLSYPRLPNIHYLGHKPYAELPRYVAHFDVCIIPYKLNDYTMTVFPLKLFEFLATGRQVVSTALPALVQHEGVIGIGRSYQDFVLKIERALTEDTESHRQARLQFAKANSWESRKDKLLKLIWNELGGIHADRY